jgi:error-prone DNA polymerase
VLPNATTSKLALRVSDYDKELMLGQPPYAELHCKTNFSFLCGASHPEELAARAGELGYHALAITDQNSLAGVVRAHAAAKTAGLKLLIGAEITPEDGAPVLLYAMNFAGYRHLAHLITCGRRAAPKGACRLFVQDIADHAADLIAVVIPHHSPLAYQEIFRDCCYLAAAVHHGPDDEADLQRFAELARQTGLPLVASNDVHYHTPARRPLHDVLTAIRHGTTVAELGTLRFPNGERYLKSPAQMAELFARCPEAIRNTVDIADRCCFSLDELRYEYPEELCPPGLSVSQHLARLTWVGANERYPAGIPDKVKTLVDRELALIEELRYEPFFLTVWDLVEFARARGILCQGRGSAANSAVCFCLGITSVDPDHTDVLFERFISRERDEAPDIDVDFEHERREEVLQYIYQKYGRDRAGIVAEVICYRPRSALRDVGKALGLSLDAVDRLAKVFDPYADAAAIPQRIRETGLDPQAVGVVQLIGLATEILSFPRHLSQHVGGFVITRGPLSELVPIENAAMPERTVIQWDKDDLDTLGILKVDCLSLGMLTAIRKCFDLIGPLLSPSGRGAGGSEDKNLQLTIDNFQLPIEDRSTPPIVNGQSSTPSPLTLATVPADDPVVYDMICRADTVGVFQIESRAQMSMLPRLQPRCFYDLVIEVAIVRPGPIQGKMVHPYLRRRSGAEAVTYPSPVVEQVLAKTLGVPLFQEQVMRLAVVAAGFTPGEADQLRRAMGVSRKAGAIESFRQKLRAGMLARNFPLEFADQLYEQIRGFGEYGFPEAHAASFARLAYLSAWLKCHHPAAFTASILNSQPMGFYAPAQLVRDAQEHGVEVRPVDINLSAWDCTLESLPSPLGRGVGGGEAAPVATSPSPPAPVPEGEGSNTKGEGRNAIRLGFRLIRGMPEAVGRAMETARAQGLFRSVSDLARRLRVGRPLLARLAAADAFGSLGLSRRTALWHVLALGEDLPLFAGLDDDEDAPAFLTEMSLRQQVVADYQSVGLSLKAHPIGLIRPELEKLQVLPASALTKLTDKTVVRVAGLVLVRQQPSTSKGTIFMTLEDETGVVNLVVWPKICQRYRSLVRGATALLVQGKLERASGVIHVIPGTLEDLSQSLRGLATRSRDFH